MITTGNVNISGALHSIASDGIVAYSGDVFDPIQGKRLSEFNKEMADLKSAVSSGSITINDDSITLQKLSGDVLLYLSEEYSKVFDLSSNYVPDEIISESVSFDNEHHGNRFVEKFTIKTNVLAKWKIHISFSQYANDSIIELDGSDSCVINSETYIVSEETDQLTFRLSAPAIITRIVMKPIPVFHKIKYVSELQNDAGYIDGEYNNETLILNRNI